VFQEDEVETVQVAKAASAQAGAGKNGSQGGNPSQGFELVSTQAIYRTDGVVRRAAALQAHPLTLGARIVLHPQDAQASGVVAGAMAKVSNDVGTAALPVAVDDRVAPGCAWIESGYGATAALASARVEVRRA